MSNVHNVAAYILKNKGKMSAMKLQKLLYYAQAWHIVWEEVALFNEEIEAWANGPVIPEIYSCHRGQFIVSTWKEGDASLLSASEKSSVDVVLKSYGDFTAHELSEMTHSENPWKQARTGLPEGYRSNKVITPAAMHEYYHALSE